MNTTMTKTELTEKVGKKFFLADYFTLAAKLNYDNGIPEFDEYLNGKSLKEIDAVIHLTKFPKGLVIKIAKNFSSFPFALAYSEIKRTLLSEKIKTEIAKEEPIAANNAKHGVPALLSFFIPGLGQLIKGHFIKAITIWASSIFIWFAFFGSLVSGQVGLSILIYLIPFAVWLWNVYDAYNANENWGSSTEEIKKSKLMFETTDNKKIIFSLKTADIFEVKQFLNDIHLKYDTE